MANSADMLRISSNVTIPDAEIELTPIRAQGAGGQNVNKVATAIHLRFDIRASTSLPEVYRERLLRRRDRRITRDGVIVIKAQQYRSQEANREDALERLAELLREAGQPVKKRRPTRPPRAAKLRRLDAKTRRGNKKALRGRVDPGD